MAQRDVHLPAWPARDLDSHKGDYGRVLLVGGSRGMAGSISLSAMAALRVGAGLVTVAVPADITATVAGYEPSYMTLPLAQDDHGRIAQRARSAIETFAAGCDVVACGPGLGRSRELDALVSWLYGHLPQPLILDADALNALADRGRGLSGPGGPRVLTPHPGEFGRLVPSAALPATGNPATAPAPLSHAQRRARQQQHARSVAGEHGLIIVLKGHATYVTDGTRDYFNTTGNPGMATGGTGDVLTGLLAGLAGQAFTLWQATCLAVYLHGAAGDHAAGRFGDVSLIASDLVRCVPQAIQDYRQQDVAI